MRLSHRIVLLLVWASFSVSWAQRGKRVPEHLRPGGEGGIGTYRRQVTQSRVIINLFLYLKLQLMS